MQVGICAHIEVQIGSVSLHNKNSFGLFVSARFPDSTIRARSYYAVLIQFVFIIIIITFIVIIVMTAWRLWRRLCSDVHAVSWWRRSISECDSIAHRDDGRADRWKKPRRRNAFCPHFARPVACGTIARVIIVRECATTSLLSSVARLFIYYHRRYKYIRFFARFIVLFGFALRSSSQWIRVRNTNRCFFAASFQ